MRLIMLVMAAVSLCLVAAADEPQRFDFAPQVASSTREPMQFEFAPQVHTARMQRPMVFDFAPPAVEASAVRPKVIVYQMPGGAPCGPCERLKRESTWLNVDWEFRTSAPDWVRSYPTLHWQDGQGTWRSRSGWDGVDSFLRLLRESGVDEIAEKRTETDPGNVAKPAKTSTENRGRRGGHPPLGPPSAAPPWRG